MKPARAPRLLTIFILALIVVIFLTGNIRAFALAHTATPITATVTINSQTEIAPELTSTLVPIPAPASADTTGIIALATVIVIIVLIGAVLGGRGSLRKRTPPQ